MSEEKRNTTKQKVFSVGNSWVVTPSRSHPGHVYYFNTSTGEAVWNLSAAEIEKAALSKQNNSSEQTANNIPFREPKDNPPIPNAFKKHLNQTSNFNQNSNFSQNSNFNQTSNFSQQQWASTNQQQSEERFEQVSQFNILQAPQQSASVYTDIPLNNLPAFDFNALSNRINGYNVIRTPAVYPPDSWTIPRTQQIIITPTIPLVNQAPANAPLNVAYDQLVGGDNNQPTASRLNQFQITPNRRPRLFQPRNNLVGPRQFKKNLQSLNAFDLRQQLYLKRRLNSVAEQSQSDLIDEENDRHEMSSGPIIQKHLRTADVSSHIADIIEEVNSQKDNAVVGDNSTDTPVEENPSKLDLTPLKRLAPSNASPESWYIVVDLRVLLDEYKFLNTMIMSDECCHLMVPQNVMTELKDFIASSNNIPARRIFYSLKQLIKSGNASEAGTCSENYGVTITNPILKTCLKLFEENCHVILLTKDIELLNCKKFIKIHIYSVDEVKSLLECNSIEEPLLVETVSHSTNASSPHIEPVKVRQVRSKTPLPETSIEDTRIRKHVPITPPLDKRISKYTTAKLPYKNTVDAAIQTDLINVTNYNANLDFRDSEIQTNDERPNHIESTKNIDSSMNTESLEYVESSTNTENALYSKSFKQAESSMNTESSMHTESLNHTEGFIDIGFAESSINTENSINTESSQMETENLDHTENCTPMYTEISMHNESVEHAESPMNMEISIQNECSNHAENTINNENFIHGESLMQIEGSTNVESPIQTENENNTEIEKESPNNPSPISMIPNKRRDIKLNRFVSSQHLQSVGSEKKSFRWRRKRNVSLSAATVTNNDKPRNVNQDMPQDASVQTTTVNTEKQQDVIPKNKNQAKDDSGEIVTSRESSVVYVHSRRENITIEESSTSGIISNTESNVDVTIDCNENKTYEENQHGVSENSQPKNRSYNIDSDFMEQSLKTKIEEWVSRFLQTMEEVLTIVVQREPMFANIELSPPWTLHEVAQCIGRYCNNSSIKTITDQLSWILFDLSDTTGKRFINVTPNQFMQMFNCGMSLLNEIKAITTCEEIQIAKQSLRQLLSDIKNPNYDCGNITDPQEEPADMKSTNTDSEHSDLVSPKQNKRKYALRSSARPKKVIKSPVKMAQTQTQYSDQKSSFFSNLSLMKVNVLDTNSSEVNASNEPETNEPSKLAFSVDENIYHNASDRGKNDMDHNSSDRDENAMIHNSSNCDENDMNQNSSDRDEDDMVHNSSDREEDESEPSAPTNIKFVRNFSKFDKFEEKLNNNQATLENNEEYLDYEEDYEYTPTESRLDEFNMSEDREVMSAPKTQDTADRLTDRSREAVEPPSSNECNATFKLMICVFLDEVRDAMREVKILCDKCYAALKSPTLPDSERADLKNQIEHARVNVVGLCLSLDSMLLRDPNATRDNMRNALKYAGINIAQIDRNLILEYWNTIAHCKKHAEDYLYLIRDIITAFET